MDLCILYQDRASGTGLRDRTSGAYQSTWNVGFNLKIPFIDKVARKVNLKEQVADFPPQPVITKDNVTMRIDTVVFTRSQIPSCSPTV